MSFRMSGWKRLVVVFAVLWSLVAAYFGISVYWDNVESFVIFIKSDIQDNQFTRNMTDIELRTLHIESKFEAGDWVYGDESDRAEILEKYHGTKIVTDLLQTEKEYRQQFAGTEAKLHAAAIGCMLWALGMTLTLILIGVTKWVAKGFKPNKQFQK